MTNEVLIAIEHAALDAVTGGRIDAGPKTCDPKVSQALTATSQAFQQGCQAIAQGKQQSEQQLTGMMQQMAQGKGGAH
jgi:hypothetical protein